MTEQLQYQVFTVTRPGLSRDLPPGFESLMWVANSATLISGERDAVLVDTFLTIDQGAELADKVEAAGKHLTHIYITHPHGDHFFGLNALRRRFPDAKAVATASVVDRMPSQFEPTMLDGVFRRAFPGQIPDDLGIAERLEGESFELEGHALIPIETGYTDTVDSTSLHVPSIGLIVAGDVVYNGIHPYLAETTTETRRDWIAALDTLEALAPRAVVAGHKNPDDPDDPRHIAKTRDYLRDFNRLAETADTPRELFDAMIALHPGRANPGSLWGGANAAITARERTGSPAVG
jgi:glyoxylase-like metal-dependent hydrolase (beta-lactamase superfamily II)